MTVPGIVLCAILGALIVTSIICALSDDDHFGGKA